MSSKSGPNCYVLVDFPFLPFPSSERPLIFGLCLPILFFRRLSLSLCSPRVKSDPHCQLGPNSHVYYPLHLPVNNVEGFASAKILQKVFNCSWVVSQSPTRKNWIVGGERAFMSYSWGVAALYKELENDSTGFQNWVHQDYMNFVIGCY